MGLTQTELADRTMRRRELIAIAGTWPVAWPLVARAQQQARIARLGYLGIGSPSNAASVVRVEALRTGLRDLGHVEGKNLVIEFRWADTVEQLRDGAAELVRMKVDVIYAPSSTESEPARRATNTIPIVFSTHFDPVGVGHVASLARPGGNITGVAALGTELAAKQLELLKATVPRATRFGVLYTPTTPAHRPVLQAAEAARGTLDIQLLTVGVNTVADFDGAFTKMAHGRVGAVFVQAAVLTGPAGGGARPLAELALKHRLPTMFGNRDNAVAGGLMSYAPDSSSTGSRRTATIGSPCSRPSWSR